METMTETSAPAAAVDTQPRVGKRRRIIVGGLVGFVVLLMAVYLGVSAYTVNRISQPTRKVVGNCASYGLTCQDVSFASTVDNVPLKGWFVDAPGSKAILMVHGRGGVRDDTGIGMMDLAKALTQHGYDVFTFDLRGHGASGGDRYSLGQWEVRDIAGALNWLNSRGETSIGTLGFSMGAATLLNAAPDHPEIVAMVEDSPFADLSELLDVQLPKASGLPSFFNPGIILMGKVLFGIDLLENKPERQIARLGDRPMLLIHSTVDGTIPVSHAHEIETFEANNPHFQSWIARASGHVQMYKDHTQEYLDRVFAFYDKYMR